MCRQHTVPSCAVCYTATCGQLCVCTLARSASAWGSRDGSLPLGQHGACSPSGLGACRPSTSRRGHASYFVCACQGCHQLGCSSSRSGRGRLRGRDAASIQRHCVCQRPTCQRERPTARHAAAPRVTGGPSTGPAPSRCGVAAARADATRLWGHDPDTWSCDTAADTACAGARRPGGAAAGEPPRALPWPACAVHVWGRSDAETRRQLCSRT